MKRSIFLSGCCLAALCAAVTVFSQPGGGPPRPGRGDAFKAGVAGPHTGRAGSPVYGFTGPTSEYGFSGPSKTVSVVEAQDFPHRSPVLMQGSLVMAIGHHLYTFRDASGEITVRIGPREWQHLGSNIGPADVIEISGELHRPAHGTYQPEVHARAIRKI